MKGFRRVRPRYWAQRLQDRASGVGFDWPDAVGPLAKVREEVEEVAELLADPGTLNNADLLEGELGDLLFAVVNLCRNRRARCARA